MSDTVLSNVTRLKNDSFCDFIANNEAVVVCFNVSRLESYSPFLHKFDEAAGLMSNSTVKFAEVDVTTNREVWAMFQCARYPTIRFFSGLDNVNNYKGLMKSAQIAAWAGRQCLPTISDFTQDLLLVLQKEHSIVVLGVFRSDDTSAIAAFVATAEAMHDDYVFCISKDNSAVAFEGHSTPSIAVFKGEGDKKTFKGVFNQQEIQAFVKEASTPLVLEALPEVHIDVVDAGLPVGYLICNSEDEAATFADSALLLAKKCRGQIQFCTVNSQCFPRLVADMHVEAHDLPTFAIRRPAGNRRFLYGHEKIDEQKVDLFCQDFLDGKLTPDTKSEPVPTDHQGHVVNITASTFDDLVLKSDKDVLVDYYTQWCGRCKAMAPAYESLAKLYASDPEGSAKVTIGKIDVEANYVEFSVRRYPTIKLYPAEKKDEAIVYLGSRMTEDMAGFVREHGYHKVEAFHASKEA